MKTISVIVFLFLVANSYAQKIALIDIQLNKPILFTDSITVEQTQNYFPVDINNFDTLYADLKYLTDVLSKRQRAKMQSFELRAGSTTITVKRVPYAYGDRYTGIAKTKIKELQSEFLISSINKSNYKNQFFVERLMDYMKNNKELFKAPNEITPRIYNVIVISDK